MAIIEPQPEIGHEPLDALSPFTEAELCKPVAVKLILKQLADFKERNHLLTAQLQTERGDNDALTNRTTKAETELRVLRDAVGLTDRRDRIVRLIEFALVLLIGFMIDAARSSSWVELVGLGIATAALVGAVALIQWWPAASGKS